MKCFECCKAWWSVVGEKKYTELDQTLEKIVDLNEKNTKRLGCIEKKRKKKQKPRKKKLTRELNALGHIPVGMCVSIL